MVIYKTLKILSLVVLTLLISQLVFGTKKLIPIVSFLILYYAVFTLILFAISKQIKSIILYVVFLLPIVLLIIILIYIFLFWEFKGF